MALPGEQANQEPSYYAVLNVPKDASQEDIRRAYRSLASVFHPDKHQDEELRGQAKEAFAKLQEAYEVLSDENTRTIYDVYGKQGLTAGALPPTLPAWRRWMRSTPQTPCMQRLRERNACAGNQHHQHIHARRWCVGLQGRQP